ncbi:hypothetical protein [Streptomyces sp. V3I7]|uniref:hypothetical protein n=1 Tax=Streptomyces sp. V3I7 TaxID=3042278 RepID=UPI0027D93054|nr:hypothetical protein [Streptomyces sp. V3I7]
MEQRIGSSSQPLEGAGFDPAFIPGLTSPASAEPEKPPVPQAPDTAAVEDAAPAKPAAGTDDADGPEPESEAEGEKAADDDEESAETARSTEDDAAPGPVFEAADRRARIVADRDGVRLSLDEESCEFRWDEIGAVETESARFGKRFTVTVHTPDRRWYPIEIEAAARSSFAEWETRLDEVLDAYFEEAG